MSEPVLDHDSTPIPDIVIAKRCHKATRTTDFLAMPGPREISGMFLKSERD
jgi:hypothetical protein